MDSEQSKVELSEVNGPDVPSLSESTGEIEADISTGEADGTLTTKFTLRRIKLSLGLSEAIRELVIQV